MIGEEIVFQEDGNRSPREKLKSQIFTVQRMFIVGQVYAGVNFSTLAKQFQVDRGTIARIFERYKVNQ
jgi:hypothetical protein